MKNPTLSKWFAKFEKYMVTYKDGFYQMKHLANSPYTIIESFDKMPFCKHFRNKKLLTANTIFLDAQLYYRELEEDLWVFIGDLHHKKNINVTNIFDNSFPANFNFINLHFSTAAVKGKSMLMKGVKWTDKSWSVYKAGYAGSMCHYKGVDEKNITVYFTNEWLKRQSEATIYPANDWLQKFFQSDRPYSILNDNAKETDALWAEFYTSMAENSDKEGNNKIKIALSSFFKLFNLRTSAENSDEGYFNLSDADSKRIQKTVHYLKENLAGAFPGIDTIARKMGVSPTKLKNDFNAVHKQGIYQYYRYQQMNIANRLLTEKGGTVKDIANLLGYENASKFAAAFKEQFGVQPSAVVITLP